MENLKNSVTDLLNEMNDAKLIDVHNTCFHVNNDYGTTIYYNDSWGLQMLLGDGEGYFSIACKVFYGDYSPIHKYVTLDDDGNLKSFDDLTNYISISNMVDIIMDNLEEFEHLLNLEY